MRPTATRRFPHHGNDGGDGREAVRPGSPRRFRWLVAPQQECGRSAALPIGKVSCVKLHGNCKDTSGRRVYSLGSVAQIFLPLVHSPE